MSCSNALVSPSATSCMSRTSSVSSSDLPTVPRSLPAIGHLDVCIGRSSLKKWPVATIRLFVHSSPWFLLQAGSALCMLGRRGHCPGLRMNYLLIPKELRPIAEKVEAGQRILEADAVALYRSDDLNALGMIANVLRERKNGNYATYIHNRYINYSNICILSCQFCAFAAKKRDAHAFEYAIEIRHLAQRIFHMPIRGTLETLREAGLGSITGGGAEIFDPIVRDQICRGKETAAEWLDVHRMWHQMGGRSTCTMLYGHIETPPHRVDHLRQLRELQDETRGFTGFVPFAFEPSQSHGVLANINRASAFEQLRNLAVSRIYLDNIDHLTAYWVSLGLPLAQVSLSYGVDDLHGTILEEKIFHMAGATTPQQQTVAALEHAIREAGRVPAQRDSYYHHLNGARRIDQSDEHELVCA